MEKRTQTPDPPNTPNAVGSGARRGIQKAEHGLSLAAPVWRAGQVARSAVYAWGGKTSGRR